MAKAQRPTAHGAQPMSPQNGQKCRRSLLAARVWLDKYLRSNSGCLSFRQSGGAKPARPAASGKRSSAVRDMSLRWRLILLVVASIVPLVVFALGNQYLEYRQDIGATGPRTLKLAQGVSLLIEGELQRRIAALETLATSTALRTGNLTVFRSRAELVLKEQFPGAAIEVLTQDGREILNTALPPGALVPVRKDLASMRQVFATGRPTVSHLYQGAGGPAPVVAIDVPVKAADGSVIYVLSLHPDLGVFVAVLHREHLPANWVASVFDQHGVIVAGVPNGERFLGHDASASLFGPLQSGSEGVLDSTSLEGVQLLTAFTHGEGFGWGVAIGVPRKALLHPIRAALRRTMTVGALVLILALLLALYLSRGIARPIASLRQAVAGTDGASQFAPTGLPEVDEVAQVLHDTQGALQANEERFRRVVEAVPNALLTVDAAGQIDMLNAQAEQMFGYPRTELIGRPVETLLPERHRAQHPTMRGSFNAAPRPRLMGVGRELLALHKDGREFPVEVGLAPFGTQGGPMVLASVIDITARRQSERTQAYYAAIVESSADAIIGKDLDGVITSWNESASQIFGYTASEMIGRPILRLLPPERYDEETGILARISSGERIEHFETVRRRKDGSDFPVSLTISPIFSADGTIIGASKIVRDITERRQTEEQLRQAQKMEAIGNLTGGMAHDFNNLLGIIVGNLGLARDQLRADNDLAELIGEALDAAWRGADLTRRLLAFARRQPLRPARILVNERIADIVRLLGRLLGEDIEIRMDLAQDVWPIVADPAQLEACLANLSTNARDAMPGGGNLMIASANRHLDADYVAEHAEASEGDFVMIEVSDTGTGMPPDVMSRIFEPFFTTKEPGKGTGLGLSMVFGFLRQTGGHVSVYSEPGAGTTFRLYLPRDTTETPMQEAGARPSAARGGGETVLVVEDNPGVRRIVVRQLRSLGYQVIECERAAEALEMLRSVAIDLLFTDVVMPGGLDGVELARLASERWPALKILLTSGFPLARVELAKELMPTLQLLSKPYSREELAALLRQVLDE
jgi:PAS domain S-box-containing protein